MQKLTQKNMEKFDGNWIGGAETKGLKFTKYFAVILLSSHTHIHIDFIMKLTNFEAIFLYKKWENKSYTYFYGIWKKNKNNKTGDNEMEKRFFWN